ncbi:MAG: cupin domain-containing protein [Casimicrobiaceae bacterium]|nr:cupin domain-containing protein [Casimicrobiaceae bacterium]MCX8098619.1 cupin domain-containing protein [Casimicrobiaceae bacterium]MDW8312020.1 cupin domain-containing protein [Burkholderiales bacterium]
MSRPGKTLEQPTPLLGGQSPEAFMRRYWQRQPLLIRQALPGFIDLAEPQALMRLAESREVESRLVLREAGRWHLEHGPFRRNRWQRLPERRWTLLVQGLNHHLRAADQLLRQFDFIPRARLDDLMVSIAAPGGGVGPHYDSYDVFLLQGRGIRRWRLSTQRDLQLDPRAPLRLLRNMRTERTEDLRAADMLYLPPRVAHDGVAIQRRGFCMTYSIGFRAPSRRESIAAYLDWVAALLDEDELDEQHPKDPDLRATDRPARLPKTYVRGLAEALAQLPRKPSQIAELAGCLATQPKAGTHWPAPHEPLSKAAFRRALKSAVVGLALATRCLYDQKRLFINGESFDIVAAKSFWWSFAERRVTRVPEALIGQICDTLYDWYQRGWIELNPPADERSFDTRAPSA